MCVIYCMKETTNWIHKQHKMKKKRETWDSAFFNTNTTTLGYCCMNTSRYVTLMWDSRCGRKRWLRCSQNWINSWNRSCHELDDKLRDCRMVRVCDVLWIGLFRVDFSLRFKNRFTFSIVMVVPGTFVLNGFSSNNRTIRKIFSVIVRRKKRGF